MFEWRCQRYVSPLTPHSVSQLVRLSRDGTVPAIVSECDPVSRPTLKLTRLWGQRSNAQ